MFNIDNSRERDDDDGALIVYENIVCGGGGGRAVSFLSAVSFLAPRLVRHHPSPGHLMGRKICKPLDPLSRLELETGTGKDTAWE